jgi:signal peptide peptidase SppA
MNSADFVKRVMGGRFWFIHEPWLWAAAAAAPLQANLQAPAPLAARTLPSSKKSGGLVAVVPIQGAIEKRSSFFSWFFGSGCSTDALTDQIRQAVNDPNVSAIVLDVDSPGGDVSGIDELASEIYLARKQKPITAVSNSMMCSAAYFLASQADEVLASPSSLTGSIGVYTTHEDDSQYLDNLGVKFTLISYGANKTEGNSYKPLSDDAQAHLQEMVNSFGQSFEKAVARGRGVKVDEVQKKFGQGRAFTAQKAVKSGLADRVGTLDDALAKHGAVRPAGTRASVFSGGSLVASPANGPQARRQDPDDEPENVDHQDDNEMDFEDGDGTCECACSACKEGACDACSCSACACDGCACDKTTSARKKAAANQRLLQLAEL